jgi:hypothetical protein
VRIRETLLFENGESAYISWRTEHTFALLRSQQTAIFFFLTPVLFFSSSLSSPLHRPCPFALFLFLVLFFYLTPVLSLFLDPVLSLFLILVLF